MKILTIQFPDNNNKSPYPYHVTETGDVLRQKFWKGKPVKCLGFATKDKKDLIILSDVFTDPLEFKRARRLNPVFKDTDGEMYSLLCHAELTITDKDD